MARFLLIVCLCLVLPTLISAAQGLDTFVCWSTMYAPADFLLQWIAGGNGVKRQITCEKDGVRRLRISSGSQCLTIDFLPGIYDMNGRFHSRTIAVGGKQRPVYLATEKVLLNDEPVDLPAPAIMFSQTQRAYLPVRFLANHYHAGLSWMSERHLLMLYHPDSTAMLTCYPREEDRRDAGRILTAAAAGNRQNIERLLKANPELLYAQDGAGRTLLHFAAKRGDTAVVRLLLSRGLNPNSPALDGITPLHLGIRNADIVHALQGQGADVNARTRHGDTPVKLAERLSAPSIANFLRQHGAK